MTLALLLMASPMYLNLLLSLSRTWVQRNLWILYGNCCFSVHVRLTSLCMEFLSITLLQPTGPYFQVFNIPVIVISFIKSISVCVCMCVYVKTSSHLYRVHLYPCVPLSLVKKIVFFVSVHISLGHRAENYKTDSHADVCMGNLLPLDRLLSSFCFVCYPADVFSFFLSFTL